MKKILLPILALAMFSSLSSKGFQFWNKTGRPAKFDIEASKYKGGIEKRSVVLKEGQVYTRKDWKEIEKFTVTTIKREAGFFASETEVATIEEEEVLGRTWERNIETKNDKIRKIKIYIKNDGLRYKSSWLSD